MLKIKILILFFSILTISHVCLSQQSSQTQPGQAPQKVEIDFVRQTELSRKEMSWSKMYLESYQRTREVQYLKLAANHCFNAIKSYHLIQTSLKERTRFTYQTKKERLNACAYYDTIYKISLHLKAKDHLLPINPKYCTHSITN